MYKSIFFALIILLFCVSQSLAKEPYSQTIAISPSFYLNGISFEDCQRQTWLAIQEYHKRTNVRFVYNPRPEIWIKSGPINDTYFAVYSSLTRDITFNHNINWTPEMFRRVLMHELGHSIGLAHSQELDSIMQTFRPLPPTLGNSDLVNIGLLYGLPRRRITPSR